jgi:glycosyltransferase involved in cell wall biosynthesis
VLYAAGLRTDRVCNLRLDPLTGSLAAKACDWPADLYIAHNLAALPAACQAARHHHALLGFDAEDFHSGQFAAHETGSVLARLTAAMERRYLPQCDYVTAASPGIASAYAAHCGIAMPTVILNVFPLSQAPPVHVSHHRQGDTPSLYWFSQTIGFGRGIETLAEAVCRAACQPVLYLQGSLQAGFLEALGKRIGADLLADRVRYLEPCLPDELIRRCAEFDAGIASELSSVEINRDIALTNKIFTYMLAGVAIIASDTSAQAALAQACGEAIQLYPQDDVQGLTRLLDDLFSTPDKLAHAREHAWQLGQQRYNWDQEQHVFLDVVQACLSGRKPV